jgi:hypothetical protein
MFGRSFWSFPEDALEWPAAFGGQFALEKAVSQPMIGTSTIATAVQIRHRSAISIGYIARFLRTRVERRSRDVDDLVGLHEGCSIPPFFFSPMVSVSG